MTQYIVESKRERTKKLNCLLIQEKGNAELIYRQKTILGEAEYHNRSPKPSTSAPAPRYGGRRSPWALQATGLIPAALDRWGCKPPNATEATRSNLMPTYIKVVSSEWQVAWQGISGGWQVADGK